MYLTKDNYQTKLQENALMNHTDVEGLFEILKKFKPNRMPYELICKLIEIDGVGIYVCPYGDIIYYFNQSNRIDNCKRIKKLLSMHNYWTAGFVGTLYKDLPDNKFEAVGGIR